MEHDSYIHVQLNSFLRLKRETKYCQSDERLILKQKEPPYIVRHGFCKDPWEEGFKYFH